MIHSCGKHTYGLENIHVIHSNEGAQLHIGSFCSIAEKQTIFLGSNHRIDWLTTYPFGHINNHAFPSTTTIKGHPQTNGDVVLGNDIWIGRSCTILSGIKIGNGAVLAANAHIVKDVEPYSIVGGNPAKHIKFRYPESIIKRLLELEWWTLPDHIINRMAKYLCSSDYENSLSKLEAIKLEYIKSIT